MGLGVKNHHLQSGPTQSASSLFFSSGEQWKSSTKILGWVIRWAPTIVIHGVTIPINGLLNGFAWGYFTVLIGVITPVISGRGPTLYTTPPPKKPIKSLSWLWVSRVQKWLQWKEDDIYQRNTGPWKSKRLFIECCFRKDHFFSRDLVATILGDYQINGLRLTLDVLYRSIGRSCIIYT